MSLLKNCRSVSSRIRRFFTLVADFTRQDYVKSDFCRIEEFGNSIGLQVIGISFFNYQKPTKLAPIDHILKLSQPKDSQSTHAQTAILHYLLAEDRVSVFDFSGILCDKKTCRVTLKDVNLYRDEGHLSISGAKGLANHMSLISLSTNPPVQPIEKD